eukprot:s5796_g2.t1
MTEAGSAYCAYVCCYVQKVITTMMLDATPDFPARLKTPPLYSAFSTHIPPVRRARKRCAQATHYRLAITMLATVHALAVDTVSHLAGEAPVINAEKDGLQDVNGQSYMPQVLLSGS